MVSQNSHTKIFLIMILVTGATGHFGKSAIAFLLQKGIAPNNITALVRDPKKASDLEAKGVKLKIGDYDNYESLVKAFTGVDKLLLVSASDLEKRLPQHLNAVKAAKEVGISHIVYTSFERKNESETSPIAQLAHAHIETEKAIKESGIAYTIMRNSLYAEVLPMFIGENVLETGIYLPAGQGTVPFALREEMAESVASVLVGEGHENKEYSISNTVNYSITDVATMLSDISGKTITYTSPATDEFKKTLAGFGVPEQGIEMAAGFAEAIAQNEFTVEQSDLEKLLGRTPTPLKNYLIKTYSPSN